MEIQKRVLMRIFMSEAEKFHGRTLYQAVFDMLRSKGIAGATVLRGICGYGAKKHLHSAHLLALSQDLPIIIEAVDTREKLEAVMPGVRDMVQEGIITLEDIEIIRLERPGESGG